MTSHAGQNCFLGPGVFGRLPPLGDVCYIPLCAGARSDLAGSMGEDGGVGGSSFAGGSAIRRTEEVGGQGIVVFRKRHDYVFCW